MELPEKTKSQTEYQQSGQENIKKGSNRSSKRLYNFEWFPITTSAAIASVSFIFQIVFIIHCFDFYSDIYGQVFGFYGHFRLISQFATRQLAIIVFIISLILAISSLLFLFFYGQKGETGYKYVLQWLVQKIFPFLRYIIDANVALTALFIHKHVMLAGLFCLASIINIGVHFLCQNYTLRKDYLCCKSVSYLLMWKISLILGYAISSIGYYIIENSQILFLLLVSFQFCIFFTLFICYFGFGFTIYRHTISQFCLVLSLNLFLALSMGNLYDLSQTLIENNHSQNRHLIVALCFFVALFVLSYCLWTKIKKDGSDVETQNVNKKIFFVFNKLENSSENIGDDCQIRGIIRYHLSHFCSNPICFINQKRSQFYDSKKNTYCSPNKIYQGKTSFVKLIIKCFYEQQLDKEKWSNTELLLDYTEFYFMKLKNVFQVTILLNELQKRFLTPFQIIRFVRLKKVMLEQNEKLNQELYNGRLDIQNLVTSQNTFNHIQQQIKETIEKNISFWKYLESDSVDLSNMVTMITPTFELIQKVNQCWKDIAKYFDIQKIWKFYFLCYTLYIRNEKIKPHLLEEFGQSVNEEELFSLQSLHIDKTTEESRLFVSKMIFEQDVCTVHINSSKDKPVIKSVSRYFQRIFGFQQKQVLQAALEIMMTPSFKSVHQRLFLKWAGEGKSNREQNYQVKKVFPLHKERYVVSTFKFYKQFLSVDGELHYVAMFKRNKEQQHLIILNENFQIEGMTKSTVQKLKLTLKDYEDILGMNLLIFLPGLIENTKFFKLHQNDFDQTQKLTMMKKSSENNEKSGFKSAQINAQKQLTKNNIYLKFPHFIENVRDTYLTEKNSGNDEQVYKAICLSSNILNEIDVRQKFKVQVEVRKVQLQENNSYYECYLRQIEIYRKQKTQDKFTKKNEVFENYDDTINEQEINNFFQNSQNSQNISLAFNNNLFLKQESNHPVQMMSHITIISFFVRIISMVFVGLLVTTFAFEFINYGRYKENTLILNQEVQMILKATILINKYHSIILNIPGSHVSLNEFTLQLLRIREKSDYIKKAIFNQKINPFNTYSVSNGMMTKTIEYNQQQLIEKLMTIFIQIMYHQNGNPAADIVGFFKLQFLLLTFEQVSAQWMVNTSELFDQIRRMSDLKSRVYIGIYAALAIFGFLLILWKLIKITRSFVSLMEVFTQFSEADIKKISRYNRFLQQMFNHLSKRYEQLRDDSRVAGQKSRDYQAKIYSYHQPSQSENSKGQLSTEKIGQKSEQVDANLNKRIKKVEKGKSLNNLKYRSIVFIALFLSIYWAIGFGWNMYNKRVNQGIVEFKNSGMQIFTYYSSIITYVLAFKDRNIHGALFNLSRYDKYVNKIKEMKQITRIEKGILDGDFVEIRNNILFENVCQIYPQVLQTLQRTREECQTVGSRNLKFGLQSFIFYASYNIDYYFNSSNPIRDPDITYQIQVGSQLIMSYFILLTEKWNELLVKTYDKLIINLIVMVICFTLLQIILYIVIIELCIVNKLKNKFLFFSKIYNNLVPDYIVTNEKIIKAKLIVDGILKK